jgi:hypothetical protein
MKVDFILIPKNLLPWAGIGVGLPGRLEAISKKGFWVKIKAGPSFNPQAYSSMSRT